MKGIFGGSTGGTASTVVAPFVFQRSILLTLRTDSICEFFTHCGDSAFFNLKHFGVRYCGYFPVLAVLGNSVCGYC